jgi:hypothetical protein
MTTRDLNIITVKPLPPTNYPPLYQDQLSAEWNFYVNYSAKNELFVVVSDVVDSHFGYIYGQPVSLVALTGFDFSLPIRRNLADPSFSDQHAVAGQFLANGGPGGSNFPIDTTPGWSVPSVSGHPHDLHYDVSAPENYAFSHFTSVYGATRLVGGGV